jgi:hypothetical protein
MVLSLKEGGETANEFLCCEFYYGFSFVEKGYGIVCNESVFW